MAPRLVEQGFTVVCADLPGYCRSGKPTPTPDHVPHSKRVGAELLVRAMQELGHGRFAVAGHDRGELRRPADGTGSPGPRHARGANGLSADRHRLPSSHGRTGSGKPRASTRQFLHDTSSWRT
ncbi:alpha/beta fold hydrolase [Citricoccus parietis]|uniref:Alpha/beta fold hydrolase n=1 Tax=Citricoccus parietis TaxID=592307 RepID=A0ABV5G6T4_9MICC